MIFLTQLIYLIEGQEETFHEFENTAIPLMKDYGGNIIQRIRPQSESFIEGDAEKPYEIHIISFESETQFQAFLKDPRRQKSKHLKEQSVSKTILVKGHKI